MEHLRLQKWCNFLRMDIQNEKMKNKNKTSFIRKSKNADTSIKVRMVVFTKLVIFPEISKILQKTGLTFIQTSEVEL